MPCHLPASMSTKTCGFSNYKQAHVRTHSHLLQKTTLWLLSHSFIHQFKNMYTHRKISEPLISPCCSYAWHEDGLGPDTKPNTAKKFKNAMPNQSRAHMWLHDTTLEFGRTITKIADEWRPKNRTYLRYWTRWCIPVSKLPKPEARRDVGYVKIKGREPSHQVLKHWRLEHPTGATELTYYHPSCKSFQHLTHMQWNLDHKLPAYGMSTSNIETISVQMRQTAHGTKITKTYKRDPPCTFRTEVWNINSTANGAERGALTSAWPKTSKTSAKTYATTKI